eukprot:3962728-Pleurochrysis_carterae.AAC.1
MAPLSGMPSNIFVYHAATYGAKGCGVNRFRDLCNTLGSAHPYRIELSARCTSKAGHDVAAGYIRAAFNLRLCAPQFNSFTAIRQLLKIGWPFRARLLTSQRGVPVHSSCHSLSSRLSFLEVAPDQLARKESANAAKNDSFQNVLNGYLRSRDWEHP